MNKINIALLLSLCLIMLTSCTTLVKVKQPTTHKDLPTRAFVQLKHDITNPYCKDGKTKKGKACNNRADLTYGSGAVIKREGNTSYILTVAHVCKPQWSLRLVYIMFKHGLSFDDIESKAIDYYGNTYKTEVVKYNRKHDICLVKAEGLKTREVLSISNNDPERGERYHNMAAPYGVHDEGMVLTFSGTYSGQFDIESRKNRYDMYTIAIAPGSSGSPIMDKNMNVVGLVSMGYSGFDHIAISPRYGALKDFMRDAYKSK